VTVLQHPSVFDPTMYAHHISHHTLNTKRSVIPITAIYYGLEPPANLSLVYLIHSSKQVSQTSLRYVRLAEKMSFQLSSELSMTDGQTVQVLGKTVPDEWCCNSKTPSAEQNSC